MKAMSKPKAGAGAKKKVRVTTQKTVSYPVRDHQFACLCDSCPTLLLAVCAPAHPNQLVQFHRNHSFLLPSWVDCHLCEGVGSTVTHCCFGACRSGPRERFARSLTTWSSSTRPHMTVCSLR